MDTETLKKGIARLEQLFRDWSNKEGIVTT